MKTFRICFISILVVLSIITSYILFNRGMSIGARHEALDNVTESTNLLIEQNNQIYNDNQFLSEKIESMKKEIDDIKTNDPIFAQFTKDMENYQKSITKIKQDIDTLGMPSDLNSKYAEQIGKISNDTIGTPITKTDETMTCPKDIKSGRYKIEGNGSFRIINTINNNIIEAQNLEKVESHSYTCHVDEECSIVVEGTLKLTEVK